MADILLIQPSIKEFKILKKVPDLPLSLLSVASLVDEDYSIKIIDQRLDKDWANTSLKELENNPLCVGLTAQTGKEIISALEVSRFVKEHSGALVVWGGSHASLLPRQTLENPYIDIVVKGEGEITFYELVKALKKGKSLKGIKGVWYKKDGKIYGNPDRPFADLNKLPELPYHLVDVKNYIPKKEGRKSIYVETSRGCPHTCSFCYNSVNRGIYRFLSPEKTIKRFGRLIKDYNVEHLFIVDDNYFANKKRALRISEQIVRNKMDIKWTVFGADLTLLSKFSLGELSILKKSGCSTLHLGVQSGSQRILKMLNKDINVKKVISLNRLFKKLGIRLEYLFIYGFPTETTDEIKQTINLMLGILKDNESACIGSFCYTPIPGTPMFDLALKEGFQPPQSLEGWDKYDRDTSYKELLLDKHVKLQIENLNFVSKAYSMDNFPNRNWLKLIKSLYSPIAKFRIKNMFFKFFLEKKIYDWIIKPESKNIISSTGEITNG